jgi:hypothetical protein
VKHRFNDPEFAEAWRRIFRGAGGQQEARLALQSLAAVVSELGPVETCALHHHEGRRTFAAELLRIADEAPDVGRDQSERERRGSGSGGGSRSRSLRRGGIEPEAGPPRRPR